jgi:hypothetical protein
LRAYDLFVGVLFDDAPTAIGYLHLLAYLEPESTRAQIVGHGGDAQNIIDVVRRLKSVPSSTNTTSAATPPAAWLMRESNAPIFSASFLVGMIIEIANSVEFGPSRRSESFGLTLVTFYLLPNFTNSPHPPRCRTQVCWIEKDGMRNILSVHVNVQLLKIL